MRNPFKRRQKALEADPSVIESLRDRRANFINRLGGTNQRVQAAFTRSVSASYAQIYGTSPAVRTVVDLIARNVAQLDLRLYEMLSVDERELAPGDHPASLSLRFPGEGVPPDQFIESLVIDHLVYGNAYALKFRTGSRNLPIRMEVIPASQVEVVGSFYKPDFYRVLRVDGSYVANRQTGSTFLEPRDMLHWRYGRNPVDPRIGLSPLETLRKVVAEDAANQAAIVELLQSGLGERSYVKRPLDAPEWSAQARERFEEDLTNRFRDRETPPVLEEGMEMVGIGVSPNDAQMLESRKFTLQQVASLYGVPLSHPVIGLSAGGQAAAEQGEATFYADTLPPYTESLARQLDLSILQDEFGEDEMAFEFDLDEKLMGDERLKALTSASGRPVLLTNEARAMVNRPPVDGGDELVTPQNVIVGDNPLPSTDVMPIQDPNGPSQEGDERTASIAPDAKAILHPRWRAQQIRQEDYSEELAAIIARNVSRQASAGAKSLTGKADRWDRELADDLEPAMARLIAEEGSRAARRFASTFDPTQVRNYTRATAEDVAQNFNQQTRDDLRNSEPADVFASARGSRAETVGGSLAGWAVSHGIEEAAKQSPDAANRSKTWILNTNRHAAVGGETVSVGTAFSNGSSPGIPPNCACVLEVN